MSNWLAIFAPPKHPVRSLRVQAETATPDRIRTQFEVLVRHLLDRFFHNELLTSDDETKRVMLISYSVGLPTLVLSLFLYPAYHAFPPAPYPRPFWPQVGDHYFYVMYSFLIMGAATVYEWDLLFPDALDIFVLSVLPISTRRLFFARVLALVLFLALVLIGTSILGTIFLPLVAGLPSLGRHLLAHLLAVTMSGTFAAATVLALQGILLNTVGERVFRRITPILQGGSIMLLLAVLLLYPTLSRSLRPLLASNIAAVRWFPPFWFLGVYQRVLEGPTALPIFSHLARTGFIALFLAVGTVILTYPLAYRRRVRQVVEGAGAIETRTRAALPFNRLLHATLLRIPAHRAIFHFITQTILRSPRQRVMLALYGGLALALTLSNMLALRIGAGHLYPTLLPYGIRCAIPIMAFWTVLALNNVLASPIDRRGSWLFRALLGRPGPGHLTAVRLWITLWALGISLTSALLLHAVSPASMRTPLVTAGQFIVAVGVSLLLTDLVLFPLRTIPFTHLRTSAITDFPFMIVRYLILFPFFVVLVLHREPWIEASATHLLVSALILLLAHALLTRMHARALDAAALDTPLEEGDEFPQRLGLRDS
ncbi:MAG TPA: hypothetical protein VGN01_00965 [Acidobacteriaceae bacterium]